MTKIFSLTSRVYAIVHITPVRLMVDVRKARKVAGRFQLTDTGVIFNYVEWIQFCTIACGWGPLLLGTYSISRKHKACGLLCGDVELSAPSSQKITLGARQWGNLLELQPLITGWITHYLRGCPDILFRECVAECRDELLPNDIPKNPGAFYGVCKIQTIIGNYVRDNMDTLMTRKELFSKLMKEMPVKEIARTFTKDMYGQGLIDELKDPKLSGIVISDIVFHMLDIILYRQLR